MKLVTTTSDLEPWFSDRSIAAPVAAMKDSGFRHLDLDFSRIIYPGSPWLAPGDAWKHEVEDCARIAEELGLDFAQSHAPDGEHYIEGEKRDNLLLALHRTIEACGMLGIPNTVIHGGTVPGLDLQDPLFRERSQKPKIAFYALFEDDCERYDVDMLCENGSRMWIPTSVCNTGADMRELVELAKLPRLHICWDVGHANCEGCDQYSDLLAMGSELKAVHLHDNLANGDAHAMPMTGTVNFDRVLQGMRAIDFQGCFTFECMNTLRRSAKGKLARRDVQPEDKLGKVPLALQQAQQRVTYEIGKWMLESYGYSVE